MSVGLQSLWLHVMHVLERHYWSLYQTLAYRRDLVFPLTAGILKTGGQVQLVYDFKQWHAHFSGTLAIVSLQVEVALHLKRVCVDTSALEISVSVRYNPLKETEYLEFLDKI